jgi:hypothetical protein
MDSTRTLAASLAGTSTTRSPSPTSRCSGAPADPVGAWSAVHGQPDLPSTVAAGLHGPGPHAAGIGSMIARVGSNGALVLSWAGSGG